MSIVTLLTDFGTADGYAGEMKGAILSGAPDATIVDIAHDIPAHDIELGRLAIARYWRRFPPGTVHVAIVDPEVGTSRLALAVESEGRFLVGPDNGLLSPALLVAGSRAVALPIPTHASATFHVRDVFAPAAARLATGVPVSDLGKPTTYVIRRTPEPRRQDDGSLTGEVIAVDRFGNAVTNLLGIRGAQVTFDDFVLGLRATYAELEPGEIAAIVGSSGLIEIVVREGRAADVLKLRRGTPISLR